MTGTDHEDTSPKVREYRPEDYDGLVGMYDEFRPKGMFQGMPPRNRGVRMAWINGLVGDGINFLAWSRGNVIGHVVIMPDYRLNDVEYLIFVGQASRGMGVGKELTRVAIEKARDLGLSNVWLTVDAYNFRAIKLYRRFHFEFKEEHCSASERTMILKL